MIENIHENEERFLFVCLFVCLFCFFCFVLFCFVLFLYLFFVFSAVESPQKFQSSYACCMVGIHQPQTLPVGEIPPPWPQSIKWPKTRTCHGEGIFIELKVEEILTLARIQGKVKIWSKIWPGH